MTAIDMTLLADSVTLVVTVATAIKRPILSYWMIAGIAACATAFATYQVVTGRGSALAVLSTSLLVVVMMWRIASNLPRSPNGSATLKLARQFDCRSTGSRLGFRRTGYRVWQRRSDRCFGRFSS